MVFASDMYDVKCKAAILERDPTVLPVSRMCVLVDMLTTA